ncbi:hypothetical protein B0H12DRAFT_2556 [Mycena haematopus]|nr:hypothetical protein B0H12DRAFT_2556 [Mycena haematopus]
MLQKFEKVRVTIYGRIPVTIFPRSALPFAAAIYLTRSSSHSRQPSGAACASPILYALGLSIASNLTWIAITRQLRELLCLVRVL